jgi:hypothetical protein
MNGKRTKGVSISKTGRAVAVQVDGTTPELILDDDGDFTLRVQVDGAQVEIELSRTSLQTLGLQCVALLPALAPHLKVDGVNAAYRLQAACLEELDDRSMQVLIRELQSDVMIDALWYMKDAGLIRKVLKNMSRRAAEMLMDDMDRRWHGRNPDTAPPDKNRSGRFALLEVLSIARRQMDEGQIPDYFGETR